MPGRPAFLIPMALLCLLLSAGHVHAHRLEAEAAVRPFGVIQVESWFETGDVPRSARVQVFGASGRSIAEGKVDERGYFVFAYAEVEPLRIVVDAGAGHRAEIRLKTQDLLAAIIGSVSASVMPLPAPFLAAPLLSLASPDARPVPQPGPTERRTGPQYGNLLVGVGVLLVIAAGAAAFRRARQRKSAPPVEPTGGHHRA